MYFETCKDAFTSPCGQFSLILVNYAVNRNLEVIGVKFTITEAFDLMILQCTYKNKIM